MDEMMTPTDDKDLVKKSVNESPPVQQAICLTSSAEQELHDFFENAPVGLHCVGSDGVIQRANRAELELLGYRSEEYIGHHISEFHADERVIADILQRLSRGDTLCNYEARLRRKDGAIRHVLINSNVLWRDGQFVHTRCFTRDITERKVEERRLVAEHAVSRVLAVATSLKDTTARILEAICQTTGWEWAALWSVDPVEDVLRCVDVWHSPEATVETFEELSRNMTFSAGMGLPGRVWETARPAWIEDVSEDQNFPRCEAASQGGLHGGAAFPVICGERVLAVMEFFCRRIKEPDEPVLAIMSAVGTLIGQFMDRRRADQLLRESEARNAAILKAALDCLISMDSRGRVMEWNPAAEETFGYSRAEAVGREMAELIIPPQFREQHRNGLAHFLNTGEGPILGKRLEITAVRKDGEEFPVELAVTAIDCEGPAMFTGHLRDITDRKKTEEERRRLLESERQARQQAETANRMKDEFLSIVSHELRTPLNAILGWSQILGGGNKVDEADLTEGMQVIERNARVQTQIIEDILDMSRIISGKVRLDVQRADLPSVIDGAIESMQPAADAKGIRVQKVLDPLAGPVSGDPARLQQVVWNLISNAIKFTPKGGRVRITLERVNSHVEISVSDNGEGIKPEFLPHVFERFRQAENATTRRHGGLGLGLSIVKQLVELHGGTVQAKSPGDGQGATFRVALPFLPLHAEEEGNLRQHPRAENAATGDCKPSLKGVKVLVVDDEPDARNLLRRLLEQCEAEVTMGESVEEAIRLIGKFKPDVLVSDIGMPLRDGYDLIRQVRSLPLDRGGKTPAIALTAFARSEDRTRAMLAGFDVHVAKPVEPTELCAVVARLAGRTG
jgi:PAS domain S-box-containing protein